MTLLWFLSLLVLLVCPVSAADPTTDVTIRTSTANATIRGYKHPYGTSFRGIRYAQPPLASLRFQEAKRLDPNGLTQALAYGSSCIQGDGTSTSEDCLFLNVFSPNNATAASMLPVYIFIHGGGFVQGSGNMGATIYQTLVNKGNILMVTINYRLGPFGFFSTRETMAPGNWAISDWIEALQWVQRYIKFFGGDPSRVTVGGQSSGAEAVSILSLTQQAKNLYNRMIIESGSAFGAAVMSYSEQTRKTSSQLSVKSNCATQSHWDSGQYFGSILICLRGLTAQKIAALDNSLPDHRMKWSIVQDKKYLPERLEYLAMKRPPVPVLIGDVHDEWLGWEMGYILHNINSTHNTGTSIKTDLANSYEMTYWNNKASVLVAANNKYVNNEKYADNAHVDWEARRVQLWSEMVFIGPVLRDAGYFMYTKSNVYLYSFDWLSERALPDVKEPKLRGVQHAWELSYLFDTNCAGYTCNDQDNALRDYITKTWINFIREGNPTPTAAKLPFTWRPTDKNFGYLSFRPMPVFNSDYHPDSQFWACQAPTIDGFKPPFC